jgi:hypothetical protein
LGAIFIFNEEIMTRFKSWSEVTEHLEKRYEDKGVYHEITWYLEKRLTLDEWAKLDDLQGQIFEDMDIPFWGIAGPIPFNEDEDESEGT